MNSQVRLYFLLANIAIGFTLLLTGYFTFTSWGNATVVEKANSNSIKETAPEFTTLPEANLFAAANEVVTERPIRTSSGALAKRFRLAGTIFGTQNFGASNPQAIIDDNQLVRQSVVMRGDEIVPGISVVEIKKSSIILRDATGEEELFLEKRSSPATAVARNTTDDQPKELTREQAAKSFGGVEVFPGRWEFDRQVVLDYYDELMNNGERMLSVFDSMDPVYETDAVGAKIITGYVVGVEGEQTLFTAAGLENGDIVRTVNSVPMANRRFAERFIKEFVNGQTEMFVLEVERDGKIEKKVYTIK